MTVVTVGRLDEFEEGVGRRVDIGDHRIAVFRVDDAVHAIDDLCSHAEASLAEGELFGTEVECPRHGAAFDVMTGQALTLPATKPVSAYEVTVTDGDVQITIEEATE